LDPRRYFDQVGTRVMDEEKMSDNSDLDVGARHAVPWMKNK